MADASTPPRPRSRPANSRALAHARECFLNFSDVEPGVVREPILASWVRSRDHRVSADHFELPFVPNPERSSSLAHSAGSILAETDDQLSGEPVSLILTDAEGVVLDRRTHDSRLRHHLDKVSLAPGFSYAEEFVGTNGIGTALEGRGPARVFGHEHYVENLEELACAGAPIHHPTSGKVLGVVDLTCWRADANQMMVAAASTIARRIEEALLEHSGRRELALLQDYLATCQRNRGPVLAISNDLVMMNDAARQLIDPHDQTTLLGMASDALGSGKPVQFNVPLPTGAAARVHCKPSWSDGSVIGGVLQVYLFGPPPGESRAVPLLTAAAPLPGIVGSGALWTRCCQEVQTHFRSKEWLLLEGEPGVGKLAVARATHLANTPAAHLRLLDGAALDDPAHWLESVSEELSAGEGTVILRHVDQLPDQVLTDLADLLALFGPNSNQWVVATRTGTGPVHGALEALVSRFPGSVVVPPLRHHLDDVRELVPQLISRLTRGASLRCGPDAMRVLMRNRWPGNIEQLNRIIRKIVAHRRTGTITLADLPAEVQATARRVLTPLESIECDAIISCLKGTDGNRAEAARHLGMSRATIYRKIRDYGIVVPPSK